ncbi:DUF5325 family protein [Viridibacillus sp. YIM B01967]|uniref:DUF5325 family protein n=1 Tax=Viridibacillus soli TaxID=2798301 RepID=A0ABS1H7N7_9BACL|nr:DUF5325 family protein [Viridibacillus soli]MBK3495415.1 DUF5325 family protein [Viridibacillus soli]
MKNAKFVMAVFALAAVLAMCSIGIAVAYNSLLGIIGGILLVCAIMGFGFKTKRQFREKGLL